MDDQINNLNSCKSIFFSFFLQQTVEYFIILEFQNLAVDEFYVAYNRK